MVPFVQRAEKMNTSANYLHSWTNADLLQTALEQSKNYLCRLHLCASDSTLPLLNISDKTAAIFLFSFPPVIFCQFTVIDYHNCKAAGQQISSQQDLSIPSLQRWSKIGLLSLFLSLLCSFPSPKSLFCRTPGRDLQPMEAHCLPHHFNCQQGMDSVLQLKSSRNNVFLKSIANDFIFLQWGQAISKFKAGALMVLG